MYCVRIRTRPAAKATSSQWAGAYANCYIEFPDARAAEVLARWFLADMGWVPDCVLQIHAIDVQSVEPGSEEYVREAQVDGYCIVMHGWPEDALDDDDDDDGAWNPPGHSEQKLAAVAGTYVDAAGGDGRVLRLGTDRHFCWGRRGASPSGTWHVMADELTLVYFPVHGSQRATLEGPWRILLPDSLVGPTVTLRKASGPATADGHEAGI